MPRLVVMIDGVAIKEVPLSKERTTLGRRPYNDIVIDHLAVSGEHAVFVMAHDGGVEVEDVGSTNGTSVNGQPTKRQLLRSGDVVEVGKYRLRFLSEESPADYEKTLYVRPGMQPAVALAAEGAAAPGPSMAAGAAESAGSHAQTVTLPPYHQRHHAPPPLSAVVRVVSGPAAGRQVALTKVVTTIGKPGVAVASITRRPHGFVLAHVEGQHAPALNGTLVGSDALPLKDGDRIVLAGTEMEFAQG